MSLATTTLASAVTVGENKITVASGTGFAAGSYLRVDQEKMKVTGAYTSGTGITVMRGVEGTATAAHASGANVTVGLGSDFNMPAPQTVVNLHTQRAVIETSYSAAGAITLPTQGTDVRALINGTSALAMTLAAPTKEIDGSRLLIVANGKAAHTVTATGGFGANTTNSDVITMHGTQTTAVECVAANGVWVLIGFVAGAATVAGAGLG